MTSQQPGPDPEQQPGWQAPMPPPPEYRGGPAYGGGYRPPGPPPGPPPAVPATLDAAWWLVIANAVIGIVGLAYTVTHRDEIIDRIMQRRDIDLALARTAANVGITLAVVFGIGFAIFYIFLAMKMRSGRNWARVTLTVFLGLGVLGGLTNVTGDNPALSKGLGGLALIVDVIALVLIWLRPSNEFIAAHNRTR